MYEEFKPIFEDNTISFKCGDCKKHLKYESYTKIGVYHLKDKPYTIDQLYSNIHDAYLCVNCIDKPFYVIFPKEN